MNDHSHLKQLLIENEGSIAHMYLDTVGRVTVGIGHMIPSCAEAGKLSFILRNGGMNASAEQITAEYSGLQNQTPGLSAAHYRNCTRLDMAAAAINALLDADIRTTESGVRSAFRGYDTYPAEAQDALLDMAFNLGVSGLVNKFRHLKAAAEAGNWALCAAQCRRNGISDARNEKTKTLFQTAANHRPGSSSL